MSKRKLKTVTVRNKRFKILDVEASEGYCEDPSATGKSIAIPITGDTIGELTVIIHELLHAGFWDIDETIIDDMGRDIGKVLWDLGWRNESE